LTDKKDRLNGDIGGISDYKKFQNEMHTKLLSGVRCVKVTFI